MCTCNEDPSSRQMQRKKKKCIMEVNGHKSQWPETKGQYSIAPKTKVPWLVRTEEYALILQEQILLTPSL